MGFWGTVVVARSPVLVVDRADVRDFGYQHSRVHDLGEGWQVLVTRGWNDPPDLAAASERLVAGTSAPVLAAYVCDSDCAAVFARLPEGSTDSVHLAPGEVQCGYQHRPRPLARTVADAVSGLARWGQGAGLTPDEAQLRAVLGHDRETSDYRAAQDRVYDLVPALGLPEPGAPRPTAFDVRQAPYSYIVGPFGIPYLARTRATSRAFYPDEPEVPEPWEGPAIQLEEDLWTALHHDDADLAALHARIDEVMAGYERSREERPPPPTHVEVGGHTVRDIESVLEELRDGHVAGYINPS